MLTAYSYDVRKKRESTVRAIVQQVYGQPAEVLTVAEIPVPEARDGEVLVRIRAASLRVGVLFAVRGAPFLARLSTGLRRPKVSVPGFDISGEVVAVGTGVTKFVAGDEVFGVVNGACAEYAVAAEKDLVTKPSQVTFDEAAAIPTSGLAALHGLRAGRLQPGQHVLINGASGGVGTFAVQIAKAMGAEVTGVCSTRNLALLSELGADHVIDYTVEDFTKSDRRYDLIFDNVENRSVSDCRRVLVDGGTLVLNSGTGATGLRLMVRLIRPVLLNPFVGHRMVRFLSNPNQDDLAHLGTLVDEGKVRAVVGRTFKLGETIAAFEHVETGHASGNVVVAMTAA